MRCPNCGTSDSTTHAFWCTHPVPLGEWIDEAVCKGKDMFTLTSGAGANGSLVAICKECPVRRQCAEYAIAARMDYGVWGGLLPHVRKMIRRGQRSLVDALG